MQTNRAALILIDVQNGFRDPMWGPRNNPLAEEKMAKLLGHWREQQWPIVHIQHLSRNSKSPLRPGQSGVEFQKSVQPAGEETVMQKHVNSAFIGTDLEAYLRKNGIHDIVLVGLATDHCVSTTARMAANLGFGVTVVTDATAAFARVGMNGEIYDASTVHALALASLNQEFAYLALTSAIEERIGSKNSMRNTLQS